MTTNQFSPNPMPPDEQQQADQLDQLITQRQQGIATVDPLVDALVQMAADMTPTSAFVATLAEHLRQQQADQPANRRSARSWFFFPVRRIVVAAAMLLAVGCVLFLAPVARATLWDWLYGFGLIVEERVAEQPIPLVTPVMPAVAPTPLTLPELQKQAPFAFRPPVWLPVGLRFTGGFVMPDTHSTVVTLAYHLTAAPVGGYPAQAPLLFVVISDGPIPNRPLVAEGYQQAVRIGNQTGMYTHGNWRSRADIAGTASPTAALFWDSTADAAWLTWQADGLNYLLYAQGLQINADNLVLAALSMQ